MKKIGKYEFDGLQQAEEKITALGEVNHCIVKLGHIVIEKGEYNEEGEETKAPPTPAANPSSSPAWAAMDLSQHFVSV